MDKEKKDLIKRGVLSPFEDPNFVPPYLKYLGKFYKFDCNKGNILCYTYNPPTWDDGNGSTIIVEHRKEKRWIDRFYVLFHIVGCEGFDRGYTSTSNLKGYTRQAIPSLDNIGNF